MKDSCDTWRIREAYLKDGPTIADFNVAMALETERKQLPRDTVTRGVASLIANPAAGFYLVAESEAAVVGCLLITFEWSDWRDGFFWWIQSVYVTPTHRRRGVFRDLHAEVMRMAKQRGDVCGLRLYVERENREAQATYEQLGMAATAYRLFEQTF